jgi:prephenate dehydrogenase
LRNLTLGFVGLGLIGGSIAKAMRRVYPDFKIIGFNRSEAPRLAAVADGTCNITTDVVDQTFGECDYIFLCTPVEHNLAYLKTIQEIMKPDCIITDVGSVKENIYNEIIHLGLESNFIGGHPMAGSEKTGYENTNDRLCENAYYALTPTPQVAQERVDELIELANGIGAIPVVLTPDEHDRVVAGISHLPHLIAASLVNLVRDSDSSAGTMKLIAAGGFKDITRIASSSPDMWEQICMTNQQNISGFLQDYVNSLLSVKKDIDAGNGAAIHQLFEESRAYRDSFSDKPLGPLKKSYQLFCDIIDESGAIATIATILAVHGINLKNIGIVHNREFEEGVLRIEFPDDVALENAYALLTRYNYCVHRKK